MPKRVDLMGLRVGNLVVVGYEGTDTKRTFWRCLCDCGQTKVLSQQYLVRKRPTKSCGCDQRAASSRAQTRHGQSRSRVYQAWNHMKDRCSNPNNPSYAHYGAIGVQVCQRWLESFEQFYADVGDRPDGMTLDRYPNPAGNYEPGNVRWASQKEQQRNRRSHRWLTLDGVTKPLSAWAEDYGIDKGTLAYRLNHGMTLPEALTHTKHTRYQCVL